LDIKLAANKNAILERYRIEAVLVMGVLKFTAIALEDEGGWG
jgi:hypothetical protein